MKSLLITIVACILIHPLSSQNTDDYRTNTDIRYDLYGRMIKTSDGEKVNFNSSAKNGSMVDGISLQIEADRITAGELHRDAGLINCDPAWQFAIMGTSIGRKSMQSADIDGDGAIEIICSAELSYTWTFWYVLRYEPATSGYVHEWISEVYNSEITRLAMSDADQDGDYEIYIGFNDGKVRIYDAPTKALMHEFTVNANYEIRDIRTGDADNDGAPEIVVADEEDLYLYNPETLALESTLHYRTNEFRLGNVDADHETEIVLSNGRVLEYDGSATTMEWEYKLYGTYDSRMVELSDIDGDGMMEIVNAESWDYIDVYDADTKSQKFQILSELDIQALNLSDVNGDDVDEILYGDGQWGEIHCINSITHLQMWQIENPEHGVTAVAVADADGDGALEVMWGAGWSSTGADYLYVAGIPSQAIEWTSIAIDGPYYALDVADVDNDGKDEIVSVSYSSGSGYDSGIITVFDAQTRQIEWQCDGTFLYMNWTGFFDMNLTDIDLDGTKEIVLASGETYTAKIWIIGAVTQSIESVYTYWNEDIDELYAQEVDDVDEDGMPEIVAANTDYLYIINPVNFSVEWTSPQLAGYGMPTGIMTGNIDDDPAKEIVCCKENIIVTDGITHEQWQNPSYGFTALDLYDFNGDGILEIVGGTAYGYIIVMDGATQQIKLEEPACDEPIDGIKVADLNQDGEPEFVFTACGRIYFFFKTSVYQYTQQYAQVTGKYNSLKIYDLDNDGSMEVLAGTSAGIIEVPRACYECLWFHAEPEVEHVTCKGPADGSIVLNVSGGDEPYSYSWNTGATAPALFNLEPGTYTYTVTDDKGCSISDAISIIQSEITTDYYTTPVSCDQNSNGTASVEVITGKPPFHFLWNTGDTTATISGLPVGDYNVTVTDANSCSEKDYLSVSKEVLHMGLYANDISCYGGANGSIETWVNGGTPPYTYEWSNGYTGSYQYNLTTGDYSVTVTDQHGCTETETVTIHEPPEMLTMITTTWDDPSTPFGEGTATINVIGGDPPYSVQWDDPFQQTGVTAINLTYGRYIATVKDASWCISKDTAFIDSVLGIPEIFNSLGFRMYPNPTKGMVHLEFSAAGTFDLDILVQDFTGKEIYAEQAILTGKVPYRIDISSLPAGLYCISIIFEDKRLNKFIALTE